MQLKCADHPLSNSVVRKGGMRASRVELKDAVPDYNYRHRRGSGTAAGEPQQMVYTTLTPWRGRANSIVFEIQSTIAVCVNVFIFVSG